MHLATLSMKESWWVHISDEQNLEIGLHILDHKTENRKKSQFERKTGWKSLWPNLLCQVLKFSLFHIFAKTCFTLFSSFKSLNFFSKFFGQKYVACSLWKFVNGYWFTRCLSCVYVARLILMKKVGLKDCPNPCVNSSSACLVIFMGIISEIIQQAPSFAGPNSLLIMQHGSSYGSLWCLKL